MTAEFVPASRLYDVHRGEPTVPYWVAVTRALVTETDPRGGAA
ncbi:hypothetical protein ACFQGT_07890 [Natrialbaceae archaeon GCM10025810]